MNRIECLDLMGDAQIATTDYLGLVRTPAAAFRIFHTKAPGFCTCPAPADVYDAVFHPTEDACKANGGTWAAPGFYYDVHHPIADWPDPVALYGPFETREVTERAIWKRVSNSVHNTT